MRLPETIPAGARIVVRTYAGLDPHTGRQQYRCLLYTSDAADEL